MITVRNGKVTHPSDESGDYQPNRQQLYYFYWWLNVAAGCLDDNVRVYLYEYQGGQRGAKPSRMSVPWTPASGCLMRPFWPDTSNQ
jgi:hypothetical protein